MSVAFVLRLKGMKDNAWCVILVQPTHVQAGGYLIFRSIVTNCVRYSLSAAVKGRKDKKTKNAKSDKMDFRIRLFFVESEIICSDNLLVLCRLLPTMCGETVIGS